MLQMPWTTYDMLCGELEHDLGSCLGFNPGNPIWVYHIHHTWGHHQVYTISVDAFATFFKVHLSIRCPTTYRFVIKKFANVYYSGKHILWTNILKNNLIPNKLMYVGSDYINAVSAPAGLDYCLTFIAPHTI